MSEMGRAQGQPHASCTVTDMAAAQQDSSHDGV